MYRKRHARRSRRKAVAGGAFVVALALIAVAAVFLVDSGGSRPRRADWATPRTVGPVSSTVVFPAVALTPTTPVMLSPPPRLPRPAPIYNFASRAGGAVYITVDDGWTPDAGVLELIQRTRLPVTAFLIDAAAQRHLAYWRAFAAAGGIVEDHTVTHPDLTRLAYPQMVAQWADPLRADLVWFGQRPTLGRAPYGAVDLRVLTAAAQAGLRAVVGWSATDDRYGLRTWDGRPLRAGEIVIMHWNPGLAGQMNRLVATIAALHLRAAPFGPASFVGVTPAMGAPSGE